MIKKSDFRVSWWLSNRHFQTLWGPLFRRQSFPSLTCERLELSDGDFIDLVWTTRKCGPIVVVLHGLEGSYKSHYIPGIFRAIHNNGWRAVLMHFRGCSGVQNRLLRTYHSGETGDLETVIRQIKFREPNVPVAALGYSIGGNMLLKWLGETGTGNPLCASVAVSPTFDLSCTARELEQGFSRLYQWHLLKRLVRKIRHKSKTMEYPFDIKKVNKLSTFRSFDDYVTAPLYGFSGVDDYYSHSSCGQYLRNVSVPTLILHARDDPFSTDQVIPGINQLSSSTTLELCSHGGHVGFVQGAFSRRVSYWLEERIPEYFSSYLDKQTI